jgi:hypothetical protein
MIAPPWHFACPACDLLQPVKHTRVAFAYHTNYIVGPSHRRSRIATLVRNRNVGSLGLKKRGRARVFRATLGQEKQTQPDLHFPVNRGSPSTRGLRAECKLEKLELEDVCAHTICVSTHAHARTHAHTHTRTHAHATQKNDCTRGIIKYTMHSSAIANTRTCMLLWRARSASSPSNHQCS